jgi:hypothetical protein
LIASGGTVRQRHRTIQGEKKEMITRIDLTITSPLELKPCDYSLLAANVADEMRERTSRIRNIQPASVFDVSRELIGAQRARQAQLLPA